jgi:hypothetical protein
MDYWIDGLMRRREASVCKGLLSPALSSNGGEGEDHGSSVRGPDARPNLEVRAFDGPVVQLVIESERSGAIRIRIRITTRTSSGSWPNARSTIG